MPKVCFILNSFNIGGIERVIVSLVNSLSKYQRIDLFVLKNHGILKSTLSNNINIVAFDDLKVRDLFNPLCNYLRQSQPDYLVTSIYPITIIGVLALSKVGINCKQIVTHHSLFDIENKKNSFYNFILLKMIKKFYNRAYKTLAVSDGVFKFLSNVGVKNVEIMYNPIDVAEKEKNVSKELNNVYALGQYVLFLGRLVPVKNIGLIIKSFSKFINNPNYNAVNLVVIGSGPEENKLKELACNLNIAEKCKFLGSKAYPEAYIKNAKLLLMASFSEAMPVTVMEAFSFNVPVVSTPARGCLDIFNLLGYDYHINSFDDENEYSALMSQLLEEKHKFSWLSQRIYDNYGIETITKKWNEILK